MFLVVFLIDILIILKWIGVLLCGKWVFEKCYVDDKLWGKGYFGLIVFVVLWIFVLYVL